MARFEEGALGLMGLGFKSPLAYTSAFYFICRKDGMERKYMMYEGEDGNSIDLLYEQITDESNGVKVIVPLKSGDLYSFIRKIKEQLAYFESVYFECGEYVTNDYNINRSDDFQYSDLSEDSDMHICLDNVYYPLDFSKVGIDRINVPIGLRFGLKDGLFPIPNRESLRYTPEAKQTILAKITKVADYFVEKYNEQITDATDLNVIFNYYDTKKRLMILGTKQYDISTLIPFATKSISIPTFTGMKYIDLKDVYKNRAYLLGEYTVKFICRNNKISETNQDVTPKDIDGTHHYIFQDKVTGNKREYIKSILPSYNGNFYFLKKTRSFILGGRNSIFNTTYYTLLQLDKHPKHLWRKIIQEFQTIQQIYISQFLDYEAIQIPKSWHDERKNKKVYNGTGRRTKLSGQIFGKECVPLEKNIRGKSSKLVSLTLDLAKLHQHKGLIVYTSYNDARLLDPLYSISKRNTIRYVAFSDREMKLVKTINIHNFISYDKFIEGKTMPFKRLVTAYLINTLITKYQYVFTNVNHIKTVSTDLYDKITLLKDYKNKHHINTCNDIYDAMLTVAYGNNMFDPSIYSTYQEIDLLLDRLKFINIILKQSNGGSFYKSTIFSDEETHVLLVDMFKYHKQKVNLGNYKLPEPVVEIVIEESFSEEEIEEENIFEEKEEEVLELQEELV